MKTNLRMFQNWWKNTMNERRANANVDIDSNLLLLQRQQWFDFFVLSSKTIKTMKSFNINIWSLTKKNARKNFINIKTKKIYEQKKKTHIHRIFISKNWNSKWTNRFSTNSKNSKNLFNRRQNSWYYWSKSSKQNWRFLKSSFFEWKFCIKLIKKKKKIFRLFIVNCAFLFNNKIINFSFFISNFHTFSSTSIFSFFHFSIYFQIR